MRKTGQTVLLKGNFIKSITFKQVVFGSFWSTTNAKRTVSDVFLKRGGDSES